MKHQPRAVWAVLFACVIAFMGIGLVDPILPVIAKGLDATPSQVELLFTSYFVVIGVSNLFAGWASSRFGTKRTMLVGLGLVVVFSAAAGASDSINAIVGFRAGWGLGIALFISTSMSVIVGAAYGGLSRAVLLFESALGVGIALGPLVGGLLGGIGWRWPFFGVSLLMAIAFVSILVSVKPTPVAADGPRVGLLEPLAALRDRPLFVASIVALLYNYGFFTLLAYTPLPLGLGVHELGLVFCAWGILVAVGAVFVSPALARRVAAVPLLGITMLLLTVDLVVIAAALDDHAVVLPAIVLSGLVLGVANATLSSLLLGVSTHDASVAASGTNFVRFVGGALAPFLAGKLSEHVSTAAPIYVAAGAVGVGCLVLLAFAPLLGRRPAAVLTELDEEHALAVERVLATVD
jgi:MFS family permease